MGLDIGFERPDDAPPKSTKTKIGEPPVVDIPVVSVDSTITPPSEYLKPDIRYFSVDTPTPFHKSVDVLNYGLGIDYLGKYYGGWQKGGFDFTASGTSYFLWFPKLSTDGQPASSSGWINTTADEGRTIIEKATEENPELGYEVADSIRLVFTKTKNEPYLFSGVYLPDKEHSSFRYHVYKRAADVADFTGKTPHIFYYKKEDEEDEALITELNGDINDFKEQRKNELQRYIAAARVDGSLVGFIGGPPCPDFSVAGKNRGSDGENGKLSQSYVDLIIDQKPDFFLFENVKGLWRTARHRAFFEKLKNELHDAGYVTTEQLTNALEFGAPQDRDRILLFGIQERLLANNISLDSFDWEKYKTGHLDEIKALPWPTEDNFEADGERTAPDGIPKELTIEYWFKKNDVYNHRNANDYFTPRAGLTRMKEICEGDVSKKCYKRPHRWRYSPTAAYGNNEVHLHPYKERRMSAAETLAIQSLPAMFELPPDMTLSDKFKTIGNGVPFMLAKGVANTIRDFLDMRNTKD